MSWKLTGLVASRKIGTPNRRLLLLSMADKANDDGTGIYASHQTLADMSEISKETVKRMVKVFIEEGLIELVGTRPCRNGATNVYRIVPEAVEALPMVGQRGSPRTGVTVTPVHRDPPTGVTVTPKPIHNPDSPSESKSHPRGARAPRDAAQLYDELAAQAGAPPPPKPRTRTQLNPALALTEKGRAFARERGFDGVEAESLFQRFRDHHLAKGSVMLDWGAAWRTWVNNEVKFNGAGRRETAGAGANAHRPQSRVGGLGGRSASSVIREYADRARELERGAAELHEQGAT